MANDTPAGLACYLFSQDLALAWRMAEVLSPLHIVSMVRSRPRTCAFSCAEWTEQLEFGVRSESIGVVSQPIDSWNLFFLHDLALAWRMAEVLSQSMPPKPKHPPPSTRKPALETPAAVERNWHIQDSQGQILALAFSLKSLKRSKFFPLRSEADYLG